MFHSFLFVGGCSPSESGATPEKKDDQENWDRNAERPQEHPTDFARRIISVEQDAHSLSLLL
jgi:hypothetical protein